MLEKLFGSLIAKPEPTTGQIIQKIDEELWK